MNAAGQIDWSRGVVDSSHIRTLQGGADRAFASYRARTGSKHHLLVDAAGVPLAVTLTGANRNDITQLLSLVERHRSRRRQGRAASPAARPDRCRPRLRPRQLPARAMAPRRQTEHRSARNHARLRTRAMALGRRAYLRVAAQLPAPTHPLGTRPGHAYGLPHPRLRAYLPTLP